MLSEKMQDALNGQINAEFYSAYLYLSMSAYAQSVNLPGFANWMRVQVQEELTHAMKLYDYVISDGGRVILREVEGPPTEWASPLAVFEATYRHEQRVTGLIHDLVSVALDERDDATNTMLQWFVKEQEEEEESADAVVQKIKRAADSRDGLLAVDRELAKRTFAMAPGTMEGAAQ